MVKRSPAVTPLQAKERVEGVFLRMSKFLSIRPRSEREIYDWLTKKEISPAVQKLLVQKLKKSGFLDDREFSLWWIEQRKHFRKTSRRALEWELAKKGVSRSIMKTLIDKAFPEGEEEGLARALITRKSKIWKGLEQFEFKKKAVAYLVRRGFNFGLASRIVDEFKGKE